jgi:hypothetical protein
MASKYQLPRKIPSYVRRLEIMYRGEQQKGYHNIICNASVFVREAVSHDSIDGGVTGHALVLFVEEEVFKRIPAFNVQKKICEKLTTDLRSCVGAMPSEFIQDVSLELYDENDPECRMSLKPFSQPVVDPDSLPDVWKPGHIRLFVSHRDEYKRQAAELGTALEAYGVSCFIAHDSIQPMEKWQHVIRKALQSMEIMLVFITDDFSESVWTNQEIGFALGRGTPIIPLKMQKADPYGFFGDTQALKGDLDSPTGAAAGIYKVLAAKLGHEERIRKALVQAFVSIREFEEIQARFKRLCELDTLTEADIQQIIDGFARNEKLHNGFYLVNEKNRLVSFLKQKTGRKYVIEKNALKLFEPEENLDEDIPF